jgi:hypothetical protein
MMGSKAIPSEADTDLAGRIRATERDRLRACVEADLDVLEPLHADDFQLIDPGGRALTKEEYLWGVASGEIDYLEVTGARVKLVTSGPAITATRFVRI